MQSLRQIIKRPGKLVVFCAVVATALVGNAAYGLQQKQADGSAARLVFPLLTERGVFADARFLGSNEQQELQFETESDSAIDNLNADVSKFGWWGGAADRIEQPIVLLSDGSTLVGQVRHLDEETASIVSLTWQDVNLPRKNVSSVLYYLPENRVQLQIWKARSISFASKSGRVWTRNGDYFDCKIKSVDNNFVRMIRGDSATRMALSRVALIQFPANIPNSVPTNPNLEVCLKDGTRLRTNGVRFSKSQASFQLALSSSSKLTLAIRKELQPKHTASDMVCGLRSLQNEAAYLSTRNPDRYQHQPLLGNEIQYRNNQSYSDEDLSFVQLGRSVQVPLGIAVPSRSSLVYQLKGEVKAIQFGVSVQPNQNEISGNVVCKVLGLDGQNQWQALWTKEVSAGRPVFTQLSLQGMKAVALAVDYGSEADLGDRVQWLMPRLIR